MLEGMDTQTFWTNIGNFYPELQMKIPPLELIESSQANSSRDLSKCRSKRCQAEIIRVGKRVKENQSLVNVVKQALFLKFGYVLSHPELHVIALFVSDESGVPIDRDALRRKNALFVWCAENIQVFMRVLEKIVGERKVLDDNIPSID